MMSTDIKLRPISSPTIWFFFLTLIAFIIGPWTWQSLLVFALTWLVLDLVAYFISILIAKKLKNEGI